MRVTAKNLMENFPELSRVDALTITRKVNATRVHMNSRTIDPTLWLVSGFLGGYGVESIRYANDWVSYYWQDCAWLYVNMGDTYNTTVCYNVKRNSFSICCLGDILENSTCYL